MSLRAPYWIGTRQGKTYVLMGYQGIQDKVFRTTPETHEFAIVHAGQKSALGTLLRVDMSPEAILDTLPIEEGDRILLFGLAQPKVEAVRCQKRKKRLL